MKVIAQRAVYGDVNGAHDIIEPKHSPLPIFRKITRFTDRPGHLPPHLNWAPYLSGIPFEDSYILTITFPDPSASRAGMVLTHALILGLEDAIRLPDLTQALATLPTRLEKEINNNSVELVIPDSAAPSGIPPGLTSVVHHLLDGDRNAKPVVWVGQEGFEEIITALWRGLWPSSRRAFRFGFGFAPQYIEGQKLTIVAIPEGVEDRWGEYLQARISSMIETPTRAEGYLLGLPEGEPLQALLTELETEPHVISDLKKVEACHVYLENIRGGSTEISVGSVRMLVRLLGTLSPKANLGSSLKAETLDLLLNMTERGTVADLKALRNFDTRPFEAGDEKIKKVVNLWVQRHLLTTDPSESKQSADLIQASLIESTSSWGKSVQDAFRKVISSWQPGTAQMVWQWWQIVPTLVEGIEHVIPNSKKVEIDLAEKCPKTLPEETGEKVLSLARRRNWFVLHAAAVVTYCEPDEAINRQLQVDKDESRYDGLRVLVNNILAPALLKIALTVKENRLLKLAGEACAHDPSLMTLMDVQREEWRKIWLNAIEAGAPTVASMSNPREVVDELITLLISETDIEGKLLEHIAATPYADLTLHPKRKDAWQHMDILARKLFLNATADGWLERFNADSTFDLATESVLEEEILSQPRIAKHVGNMRADAVSFLVSLFGRFTQLKSQQFKGLLDVTLGSGRHISSFNAVSLGRYVRERGWRDCAKQLTWYLEHRNRRDLAPAVRECQNLLGWIDSFRLKWTGKMEGVHITEDDWWHALNETAAELYKYGPDQDQLWERAGGDLSTVNRHQSGRAGWGEALQALRHGGGGDIKPYKLLREMRRDYPNNPNLNLLQQWLEHR